MDKIEYKYGVFYTDGGFRDRKPLAGAGHGIHGYLFNELPSIRFAKVPVLLTPHGYEPKMSGAELKDEKYDPEYKQWDLTITAKEGGVVKDGADIKILDCWACMGIVTAQRGELESFIHLVESDAFECEYLTVHSDSNYLVMGVKRDLPNWKKNNWCKRDNTPIANQDLWIKIDAILEERGDKIDLRKIKAHDGHYGNEAADRNATMGVAGSCNAQEFTDWIMTDVHDADYWEPEKPLPIMLQQKWNYTMSETPRMATSVDSEVFNHYFMGDHNKSKDDIELLGKHFSDAGFSLVLHKERADVLDTLVKFHVDNMWNHSCNMYKSELMMMVNCANLIKPKNTWEVQRGRPECLFVSGSKNDVSAAKTEDLITKVIRPPKLSFRVLDIEEQFKEIIYSYLHMTDRKLDEQPKFKPMNIVLNDVTDQFYETSVNAKGVEGATKLTGFYDQLAKSLTFDVKHPYNDKEAKVIFTRGVDIPSRSIMSKVAQKNPKVFVVTWQFDEIMINYGLLLECDDGIGLWSGYASTRILNPQEQ